MFVVDVNLVWMKFWECGEILNGKMFLLKLKGRCIDVKSDQ